MVQGRADSAGEVTQLFQQLQSKVNAGKLRSLGSTEDTFFISVSAVSQPQANPNFGGGLVDDECNLRRIGFLLAEHCCLLAEHYC